MMMAAAFFIFKNEIFPPINYFAKPPTANISEAEKPKITHLNTPAVVRGIYMTSWVAGEKNWREKLVKLIDDTELNAIVIDVKDYTGRIAFETSDSLLKEIGASENRIPDVAEFIKELHQRDIYVIGRISVFQDAYLVKKNPSLAVKKGDGAVWKDYKGITWLDPNSREAWDYTARVAKESEKVGFDELNFDYVRFPSDGNMKDIVYPLGQKNFVKAEVMKNFYAYLSQELQPLKIPLSIDLFGMTTWNDDDLNIGQILADAAPYFAYISPMVYPSHYPPSFQNYQNPAEHPYEIILSAMKRGSEKLIAASSTPSKLRPWLQDFDLGAVYTAEMVRQEKQAVYDSGLQSWLLWDPANKYTKEALD